MSDLEYVEPCIHRRRNGRYKITWYDASGKERHKTLPDGTGIMAARAALRAERAKADRGEKIPDDPRMTFAKAADGWMDTKVSRLRPASQAVYASHLKHLLDHFGRWKLTDINAASIAKYVAVKEGEGLKGWTIKGHLTVLSAVFTYAARYHNFTATNPVSLLDKMERPRNDQGSKRALTHEELDRLISTVPERYRTLVRVAAQTGMRQSEVLGLLWTDFNWREMTLTVSGQVSRQGERCPTKTARSMRTVEITPSLAQELAALGRHSQFIFCTEEGKPHYQRAVGMALQRAAEKAGLYTVSFHELRHSHASALIADGWDAQQVADRLGDSISTVLGTYAHAFDAAKRSPHRRERLTGMYDAGSIPEAQPGSSALPAAIPDTAEVVDLQAIRSARQ